MITAASRLSAFRIVLLASLSLIFISGAPLFAAACTNAGLCRAPSSGAPLCSSIFDPNICRQLASGYGCEYAAPGGPPDGTYCKITPVHTGCSALCVAPCVDSPCCKENYYCGSAPSNPNPPYVSCGCISNEHLCTDAGCEWVGTTSCDPIGHVCGIPGTNCCAAAGLVCDSGTPPHHCCSDTGVYCSTDSDCCTGSTCVSGTC